MGVSLKKGSGFLLSKWYLDCVTCDGSAFIGYAASLSWKGLSLSYSSVLRYRPEEGVRTDTTLEEFSTPEAAGQTIRWSSPRLRVEGTWEADARPLSRTLLESDAGGIEWNCLHPRAHASIRVGGTRLEGLGYVEQLSMTIPPWRLPFEELRWGRFLSEADSLVWIDWRGGDSLNLSFHNGVRVEGALPSDKEFTAGAVRLDLGESTVLRDGVLGDTVLPSIPGVGRLFPFRILRTRECKWLSRGVLKSSNAEVGNGWAIHEVVRWPRKSFRPGRQTKTR